MCDHDQRITPSRASERKGGGQGSNREEQKRVRTFTQLSANFDGLSSTFLTLGLRKVKITSVLLDLLMLTFGRSESSPSVTLSPDSQS